MNPLDVNDESQMFLRDKQAWENAIASYNGTDPLELWYNYICWFDYNLHIDPENKFRETLEKCLSIFEHNECYKQDIRMIKLWVKYIDLQPNPLKLYQILYQRGIGTQCASFYIGWAHYYDSANAFREAESVYNLGFQAHAEPHSELQEGHTKFRLSVSQRMLYNDSSSKKRSANHLSEQRQQITTLNPPTKKLRTESNEYVDLNVSQHQPQQQLQQHSQAHNNSNSQNTNHTQLSNHSQSSHPPAGNHVQNHSQITAKYQQLVNHTSHTHVTNYSQSNNNYPQIANNSLPNTVQSQNADDPHISKHIENATSTTIKNSYSSNHTNGSINNLHYSSNGQFLDHNHAQNSSNHSPLYPSPQVNQSQPLSPSLHPSKPQISFKHSQSSSQSFSQVNQSQTQSYQTHCKIMANHTQNYNSTSSDQCNLKNSAYVISSSLKYIYGDAGNTSLDDSNHREEYILLNVKLPGHFPRSCRNNYETWKPALFLEEPADPNRRCIYRKDLVYPGDGHEYSPEEIRSRKWANKLEQLKTLKVKDSLKVKNSEQKIKYQVNSSIEDQIEASTIRFSTDADGLTKNKKITIKFRREKPATITSDCSYSEDQDPANSYTYTVEQVQQPQANGKTHDNQAEEYSANYIEKSGGHRQTPKIKKIKRIKIINNYDDPKYISSSNSNSNASSSDYNIHNHNQKNFTTAEISRNEYEDANLLLSFANVSSNDSNAYTTAYSSTQASDNASYNDDSISNTDVNSSFNENGYLGNSNCSTPVRKLSQSCSKISTPQYLRTLKKHTSNISLQNDDSVCSYEQNSFFAAEHDEELRDKRLEKAQTTINTHFARSVIDPFSSELCKAFLTKLDFPSRDDNDVYKLLNNPVPKLANTRTVSLADVTYSIEKEVGRGSYGSVYKAINNSTGSVVALKYQKPPNTWELYICVEVRNRIKNYDILSGFMDISAAVVAPNASILITEFSVFGSLLDINNKIRQATKKVMHESLVMHFSSQILNIVSYLHSCKIIHADIKPDNFLLMKIPNSDSHIPSLRLIDFGCAIDMTLFPEKTEFKKVIQTDGFTCIEMQEGRPWSYQTDLFCIAGTVHVMLFGEYMQLVKKFDVWDIKQKLPRYLKKQVWTDFFMKMLNIKDNESLPDLLELKNILDDEVRNRDSELQTQIRMLSNLLHRR